MLVVFSYLLLHLVSLGLTQETTQAPAICSANEAFLQSGIECTCGDHCYTRNSPGCFCTQGFSRDSNGDCISSSLCPTSESCPPNQVYVSCANPCMPTCEEPNRQVCPTTTCTPGCVCNGDFILQGNGSQSICIPKEDCPSQPPGQPDQPKQPEEPGQPAQPTKSPEPQCPENQHFVSNGTECICDEHCYFKRSPSCICKEGYIKRNGTCISWQQCLGNRTKQCGPNQNFFPCVTPCQQTCDDPNRAPCDSFSCIPGCMCKLGLYLDGTGSNAKCVAREQCGSQNRTCSDPNSEYVQCKGCPITCENWYWPFGKKCTMICKPGCKCKSGFIEKDGKCVDTWQCNWNPISTVGIGKTPCGGDKRASSGDHHYNDHSNNAHWNHNDYKNEHHKQHDSHFHRGGSHSDKHESKRQHEEVKKH